MFIFWLLHLDTAKCDFILFFIENLQAIEDEGDSYDSIEEIWPDYPTDEDYLWNEDEY